MRETLHHNPADFNDLGYAEHNVIPLGLAASVGQRGLLLHDGIAAIFYEVGELEAQGTLRYKQLATGEVVWEAIIDVATIRHLQEGEHDD